MSDREKRLEAASRRVSFAAQTTGGTAGRDDELVAAIAQADEALTDDAAVSAAEDAAIYGTGFQKDGERIDPREVYDTPPANDARGEALEAFVRRAEELVEVFTADEYIEVHRALTAPPAVPESIRRLPEQMRSAANGSREDIASHIVGRERADLFTEGYKWAADFFANELDRALAQHSEPGRVDDTARLDKLERLGDPGVPWIARQSSRGRGYRLHQSWSHAAVQPTVREAIDAAPEPEGEKDDG